MAIGDKYRLSVILFGFNGTIEVVNNFCYNADEATILSSQAEDLVQAFRATAEDLYRATFSNAFEIVEYRVRQLPTPTQFGDFSITPTGGTLTGDVLPPQVSGLLSWKTDQLGKRHRGRTYLPPANEASVTAGVFTAAYQSAVNDFRDAAIVIGDGIETALYSLHVWSDEDQAARPVTAGIFKLSPATQRRRRAGVGS